MEASEDLWSAGGAAAAAAAGFGAANVPFGVARRRGGGGGAFCATRFGEVVVDLTALERAGLFSSFQHLGGRDAKDGVFRERAGLTHFMARGRPAWREARAALQRLFATSESVLRDNAALRAKALVHHADVDMLLPTGETGPRGYTDFYSSRHHAENVGEMFRGARTLPAAWLSIPIAYHGRASSVVPTGTPVRRPCGQILPKGEKKPIYSPCRVLDFELEMAAVVGPGTELGSAVGARDASAHIFGLSLMNDWSARDIQKFEYVPLGPFGSKNFATTLGPWVVTLEALEPFACAAEEQSPGPLPYLDEGDARRTFDIDLGVNINGHSACKSNYKHLYWTAEQQLSHHTVTGCSLETGDLFGSGTISGPGKREYGCMLELSWQGSREVALGEGAVGGTRTFIEDGDSVVLTGVARSADGTAAPVSFGECEGTVLPATPLKL